MYVFFLDDSFKTFYEMVLIKKGEVTLAICQNVGLVSLESEGYFFSLVESMQGLMLDRPLAKTKEVGILSLQVRDKGSARGGPCVGCIVRGCVVAWVCVAIAARLLSLLPDCSLCMS